MNRGKVLGGTSAINLLCWDRPSVADYDAWESFGNPTWNWNNMLRAMLKVENFTGINTSTYGSEGVGTGGPIDTVVNRAQPTQQTYWIPTLTQLGFPHNLNSLGGNPLGVELQPSNIDQTGYVRKYSANAYLPEAGSNLEVRDITLVNRVLFSKHSRLRATGVELNSGLEIKAKKEVILSAGTVQSPGILERSGIGQRRVLAAAGIDVLHELSGVGENLQDHVRIANSFQLRENYTSFDFLRVNATFAAEQLALYDAGLASLYDFTGSAYLFTTWQKAFGPEIAGHLANLAKSAAGNTPSKDDQRKLRYLTTPLGDNVPQLEIIFSDGYTGVVGYPATNATLYGKGFFTLIAGLQHPFSKGSIHINSTQPAANPLINPNYLSNEYEMEALIQIVRFNRRIATTYPLSQSWVAEYEPGAAVQSDEEIKDYIRRTVASLYHPVGTCAMLPLEDGGVVDSELRVYGTENLRIVDASIMPSLVPGHIQTGVYATAERAADFIVS